MTLRTSVPLIDAIEVVEKNRYDLRFIIESEEGLANNTYNARLSR